MKELRIGLVLYGGVSLAVYMNGIVTELWHALRASQSHHGTGRRDLEGTASVYRELFERLETTPTADALRIVVDAVAGTSAGGVNGAVLAKAVVMAPMRRSSIACG
jgi:predicted acylesterase/phospholipase RssA